MDEQYVARQSAVYGFRFWLCVLLLILGLIPGAIYIAYKNIAAHRNTITFYEKKYVTRSGIFNTKENEVVLTGVLATSVNQTFGGKIFKYGDVKVDVAGKNDIVFYGVKYPNKLREYLKTREMDAENVQHVITD